MPHTTSEPIDVTGACYCGDVRFQVQIPAGGEVQFTAFCHCESSSVRNVARVEVPSVGCRRAHSAPLYQTAGIRREYFEVTAGEELLTSFRRPGEPARIFCRQCGSKLMNEFPDWRPGGHEVIAWFPSLLSDEVQRNLPEALQPRKHAWIEETVLRGTLLESMFD